MPRELNPYAFFPSHTQQVVNGIAFSAAHAVDYFSTQDDDGREKEKQYEQKNLGRDQFIRIRNISSDHIVDGLNASILVVL